MPRIARVVLAAAAAMGSCTSLIAAAGGNPTVRYYRTSITPNTVAGGSATTYSLVIESCDATACPGQATTGTQAFRSATVAIPAGFSVSSVSVSAPSGKSWSESLSGSTLTLGATQGNQGLDPGQSLTITIHATAPAPCSDTTYSWNTAVYQDSLNNGVIQPGTPYTLVGSQPSVLVTGNCVAAQFSAGQYCSYTQGGWGADPHGNNPGQILASNFGSVYGTGGLAVGIGHSMTFPAASDIAAYLPAGGTPGALIANLTAPTSTTAGVFGGQVLALRLNVDFNNKPVSGVVGTSGSISSLKLKDTGTSLDGKSVAQILQAAESVLGGGTLPSGYTTISAFNGLITALNEAFDGCGQPTDWAQLHLSAH